MIEPIALELLNRNISEASRIARKDYPFQTRANVPRKYSRADMLAIFIRDGFTDRYSGEKLYHPGFLRILNVLLPKEFPFHPHGKAGYCHDIYWDLLPSVGRINKTLYRPIRPI